ncbi:hypothetical protein HC776_02250 [bacterium]|nr:hypothetical protein [bacterium]
MRLTQSLNGTWQFQLDPDGTTTVATMQPTHTIAVPLPWQAAYPDLQAYSGYAWYQREIDIAPEVLTGEVLLTFGAVDYWCEVFINGVKAGEHEGGYTPFTLPIAAWLHAGSNTIAVRVFDTLQTGNGNQRHPAFPLEKSTGAPPFGPLDIPHGKQEWYINVGGIWQDVTLTAVPTTYLESAHVTGAMDGTATVHITLSGAAPAKFALEAAIVWEGQTISVAHETIKDARQHITLTLRVRNPHLWSHNQPALYTLVVKAGDDERTTRFGFREISTRDA